MSTDRPPSGPPAGPPEHAVRLSVDGHQHALSVEPRESLWETLTLRLGQRGANLGCDRAQCGACNVIVDGRAVNGCALLTARLDGAAVRTAAGLEGGPGMAGLHPLQRAFWAEGAFQCGICTKGFMMSSLALLERNPEPSEAEISEALSGILCRCGEQARIIRAVRRAAAEMADPRAAPPIPETLMPHTSEVLGTRVPRIHGRQQLTAEGEFVSLLSLEGQVFVRALRSPYPRARVLRVDASRAEQMPGVVRVLHHFNLPEPYEEPMKPVWMTRTCSSGRLSQRASSRRTSNVRWVVCQVVSVSPSQRYSPVRSSSGRCCS